MLAVGLLACSSGDPDVAATGVTAGSPTTGQVGAEASTAAAAEAEPSPAGTQQDDGRRRVLLVGGSLMFGAQPAMDAVMSQHDVETRYVGFLCPGGQHTASLEVDGNLATVRADDSLHLNDAGDRLVAQATWSAISGELAQA